MAAISSLVGAVAFLGLILVHVAAAAIVVRFYRLQVSTRVAILIYVVLTVPVVYLLSTLVVFGALGVGGGMTVNRETLFLYLWALPFAIGAAFERFWMPPPTVPDGEQGE